MRTKCYKLEMKAKLIVIFNINIVIVDEQF